VYACFVVFEGRNKGNKLCQCAPDYGRTRDGANWSNGCILDAIDQTRLNDHPNSHLHRVCAKLETQGRILGQPANDVT
jgi:hypothetical protein